MKEYTAQILPLKRDIEDIKKGHTILSRLDALNQDKRIKLRARSIPSPNTPNKHSLYLDISRYGKRERRFIRIYILNEKTTRIRDKEQFKLALEVRDNLELELFQNEFNFKLNNNLARMDFIEFFKSITDAKTGGSLKPYKNTYKYLSQFARGSIAICDVDRGFCVGFKEFLLERVSQNTAHTYFARLRAALNVAIEREMINRNPCSGIKISKTEVHKEFLTVPEIKALKHTACPDGQTKNAFLFSCFTGLRYGDIEKLQFEDIKEGYLHFQQQKTKGYERIKLSQNALKIIQRQRKINGVKGKVFHLLYHTTTQQHINQWVEDAGIIKHITWHSGRHTFATMALTHDIDLYTVSKLLGHKEIKTTQIYAKLIDKKKDEAVDKLPII